LRIFRSVSRSFFQIPIAPLPTNKSSLQQEATAPASHRKCITVSGFFCEGLRLPRRPGAEFLDVGPEPFCIQTPDLRRRSRARLMPGSRGHGRLLHQMKKALQSILAVAPLCAKSPGLDDDFARCVGAFARKLEQALPDFGRQRSASADIETKLDGGGHLIDVLAARSRSAHKIVMNLIGVDSDRRRIHRVSPRRPRDLPHPNPGRPYASIQNFEQSQIRGLIDQTPRSRS